MQKIIDSIGVVLDFLKGIPLSTATVNDYKTRYKMILTYCQENDIIRFSYDEARVFIDCQVIRYEKHQIDDRYLRRLRRSAFLLADCMEGKGLVWKNVVSTTKMLNEFYEGVLLEYKDCLSSSLSPGTIPGVLSTIRQFLSFLEGCEVYSFSQLTANHVKNFMRITAEKNQNISDPIWAIRKFILFLNEKKLSVLNADRYLLRPASKKKKVLPCFKTQEAEEILSVVDTTTKLGKRDYAILKLAIETGLRGVDILNLQLKDINWYKCEINVVQSKTCEPIQLPLLADVGNAIAEYILHARPESSSPHIFLRSVRPYIKLGNTGQGNNIISRYLAKAGILHTAWDGKTFHAFRRTQGTRLVEAEVPLPYVAQLLGHTEIDSAKRYISQDDDKLRACCLDISEYATRKEGLYEL